MKKPKRGPYKKEAVMTEEEKIKGLDKSSVRELTREIESRGYFVSKIPPTSGGKVFTADVKKLSGNRYRFAVISCTQLGSKYQQLTHLHTFYSICKSRGINTVLHCGDVVDGGRVYHGQEYELFVHGVDEQTQYVIDNYPKVKGINTKMILGNHDESFYKIAGVNVIKEICSRRDDLQYLGDYLAYIDIGGIRIGIMHGAGGVAYARSYKLQKIIEQLSPDKKPQMLFIGHWHVQCELPAYRNVFGYMMGAFQSQTPFLTRLGLAPNIGGLIIEIVAENGDLKGVKSEWIPFFVPVKEDY